MAKTNDVKNLEITENYVQGTVKELIRGDRLRVNGQKVDQPALSVLARLGIATEVGVADRPEGTRGPAPKVYRLNLTPAVTVARK